jgi:UDP-2-acetamido-3-amino-2,3-dideoxy-glucuronate N-acetyltransferase
VRPCAVVGLGEIGTPLLAQLQCASPEAVGYDLTPPETPEAVTVLHVCFPFTCVGGSFVEAVQQWQTRLTPQLTIVHSTVPVGTTRQLDRAVHSPVLGDHTNMAASLRAFVKWVGGPLAAAAARHLEAAGFRCHVVATPEETELLKLMCLAKYGVSLAFAQYQADVCEQYGIDAADVLAWDENYNRHVDPQKHRPLLTPPGRSIGGHCVIPGTHLLHAAHPSPLLQEVLRYQQTTAAFTAWHPCNIYPTAQLGQDVSVGMFSEIGPGVVVGARTRIGAGCFLPEGVTVEEDCFIGPHTIFANDKWPPSGKDQWAETRVCAHARIGAGATILPGVTLGRGCVIGMGAVVTKDVGEYEVWYGPAAEKHDVVTR